jgi:hypothetical protein
LYFFILAAALPRPSSKSEGGPALRSPQGEVGSAKRAGIHAQIPKILKKFSDSLTPYSTTTYLFSAPSVPSVANVFFVPNAQVHPFIERRSFSAPPDIV